MAAFNNHNKNKNQPEIINLLDSDDDDETTLPRRHIPTRVLENGHVEILDSDDDDDADDEEEEEEENRKPAARNAVVDDPARPSPPKRQRTETNPAPTAAAATLLVEGNQKDLQIAQQQSTSNNNLAYLQNPRFVPAAARSTTDDDEELELLGSTGQNALSEFPHSRENCVNFIFASTRHEQHCTHCYCMVCDVPASECKLWNNNHCHAVFRDPAWRKAREQAKRLAAQPAAVPRQTATSMMQTVQPLAPVAPRSTTSFQLIRGPNLSIAELLAAATRIYPREASPPNPPFVTELRHYQKQSVAFMQDMEQSQTNGWQNNGMVCRGGWLASEVGMGKTAIILALLSSDPPMQVTQVNIGHRTMTKVKATVVMTSVTLVGQWQDECQKHAPTLNVVRYHGSKSIPTESQIKNADIIISTATFDWNGDIARKFLFRRHVWDESHLQWVSAKMSTLLSINAPWKWCVSATPMTSSLDELHRQQSFLGMPHELRSNMKKSAEVFQKYVIRHVKSQVIGGSSALTLPPSTASTIMVTPSASELRMYNQAVKEARSRLESLRRKHRVGAFALLSAMQYPLGNALLSENSSKILVLREALLKMKQKDSNVRAVVFTQMREMQQHVFSMIERMQGIQVYALDGTTVAKKRDDSIRKFQSIHERGAAVFCITLGAGCVGVTLSAATHVFLMEPCINPAHEIQAAGRIHRLGQTKPVHITKYWYANTFEKNIVKLHKQIAEGKIQFTNSGVPREGVALLLKDVI